MRKKATRKDFYMEIRKSPGRFLSILFIVMLGVAFFSGIRASEPDMRMTGDAYFDAHDLMDIQVISTYGLTDDDIAAFAKADGVEQAVGAYSADFMQIKGNEQKVLHIMSYTDQINQITVAEGRLPEKIGECLADSRGNYHVGDMISLRSGTSDEVTDTLKTDTLEVVGIGSSPCYISYGRGSTTIGTGSVSAFLIVPEDTFDMDVYTEAYLQVEGAKEAITFTDDYENRVEDTLNTIKSMTDARGEIRRQELVDEAEEKLEEARQELADGQAEAASKLADGAAQIADAEKKLESGRAQVASGRKQMEDAKALLESKQSELNAAQAQYQSGLRQYQDGRAQYEAGRAQLMSQKEEVNAGIQAGQEQLTGLKTQLDEVSGGCAALREQVSALEAQKAEAAETWTSEQEAALTALQAQLTELTGTQTVLQETYDTESAKLEMARQEAERQFAAAEEQLAGLEAELNAAQSTLNGVSEQLSSGKVQIQSGWSEIRRQEKKLEDGVSEIARGEAELKKARADYEQGKTDAEEEIAEAQAKITDAEKKIQEIEKPEWYVYDRSNLVEFSGYGENAERMGAIGRVFPVLFFLVAALISLTSMTRMVEEQRTAIGTMKALGYGKWTIASKYLGYAFLATVTGSVLGVLVGEKILPFVIVFAYGILYPHITHILVPYVWSYAGMATAAALVCTIGATFFACYKELHSQPAVLMRPPAPKNGQRVFMERITFVWRHLSFTWKSCVRNLVRYKKRFFMTIFGIGGCMALMIVGFGIKDSCYEIAELQFRDIQMYDGSIYLKEGITEEERTELLDYMSDDSAIRQHMETLMKSVTLVNGKKTRDTYECVFSDPEEIHGYVSFHDRKTKEEYELPDDGVIISEKTAKLLDAQAGDVIEIKDDGNKNREVKISQICENYMGHYIYFTPVYYETVYGEAPEYNSIFFSGQKGASKDELEAIGKDILTKEGALSVSYMRDIEQQLDDMLRSLNLVIIVLIISAGMLAFVVLYNLNTVNITERQRELATLKVLGFYDMEVAGHVYRENVVLTVIGALIGIVLGKFLHLFIIQTVEVDTAMFGRIIDPSSYLYSFLLTVLFSVIINGIMYFKLREIDMVSSLKSIE